MGPSSSNELAQAGSDDANEAFQLLSDETRIGILQQLWHAHDPEHETSVRFADLRERLGVTDPGRLNYHLNKLTDRFVRRTDTGYELMDSGKRVVRMLLSGTAIDDPEIDPVAVDISCWYCGGGVEWSYRNGWRYLECTTCDARCVESFSPGTISKNEFPPSGLRNRTPNEINDADRIWSAHRRDSVMDGVCPECAGDMPVTKIDICEDHHPDWDEYQFCEHCGSIFWMLVSHVCKSCKYKWRMPTLFYPSRHPAVVAFFYDHGIEFDLATNEQRTLLLDFDETLIAKDPLRIQLSIQLADEILQVTFDEQMETVDVNRSE